MLPMELVREVCVENFEHVPAAIAAGAGRIELCDNLAVGGTTPSAGVIAKAASYGRAHGVPVMVIIRPRGGDFCYTDDERDIMLRDIETARAAGAAGAVIGCLRGGDLDRVLMDELIAAAKGLDLTCHMAFDGIDPAHQLDALDWLAEQGVSRVLAHGGELGTPIEGNLDRLRAFVEHAAGRIGIMPGGGVTQANVEAVASALGVREAHGTHIVRYGA